MSPSFAQQTPETPANAAPEIRIQYHTAGNTAVARRLARDADLSVSFTCLVQNPADAAREIALIKARDETADDRSGDAHRVTMRLRAPANIVRGGWFERGLPQWMRDDVGVRSALYFVQQLGGLVHAESGPAYTVTNLATGIMVYEETTRLGTVMEAVERHPASGHILRVVIQPQEPGALPHGKTGALAPAA